MNKRLLFGCLTLLVLSTVQAPAQKEDLQEMQAAGEIQEVKPEESKASAIEMIGRFHPMLIHFPIAWMILLTLAELYNSIDRRTSWWRPGFYLHILAFLSFIPAALTGLILAAHSGSDPEFLRLMVPHRNLNLAGAALCFASLAVKVKASKDIQTVTRIAVLLLVLAGTSLVSIASHYGGEMVYGESFLPF
jgi:uncharacterized membrane protein